MSKVIDNIEDIASIDSKVIKVTSTDNAVVIFDGTTGQVQNSSVVIDDSGSVAVTYNDTSYGSGLSVTNTANSMGSQSKIYARNNNGDYLSVGRNSTDLGGDSSIFSTGAYPLSFFTNSTERMRIDSAGNVGIGVAPSAWDNSERGLQIGTTTLTTRGVCDSLLGANYFMNGVDRYIADGYANKFNLYNGAYYWLTAPFGAVGNPITWTTAMKLGSNGNLLVGTTTDNGVDKLQVNGSIRATSLKLSTGVQYGTGSTLTVTVPQNSAGTICINAFYAGSQAHTWTLPWIYYTDAGKGVGTPLSAGNATTLISSAVMNNGGQLVIYLAHSGIYLTYSLQITN